MWTRFVEIKSTSKMQFDMTVSYFRTEWTPRVLGLGAISAEFVQLTENSACMLSAIQTRKRPRMFLKASRPK